MKNNIFLLFLVPFFSNIIYCQENDYDLLYEWGKNNLVYISDKIAMNYTNKNTKNYYVKPNTEIKNNEIILSIPKDILLDIELALKLSGEKIKKQFEKYKKKYLDKKTEVNQDIFQYHLNYSFLAYLMTIANKNKSPKNKLYQFYKYYFNSFETDMEKYPIFYNTEQILLISFSAFAKVLLNTKKLFDDEYELLQKEIYKKYIDQDEYFKYRIFTFNKFINTSQFSSLVPFVDLFEKSPYNSNLKIYYTSENNSISVISTEAIKPKDKLVISTFKMSNIDSLISFGKIYEESKNYINSFKIAKVSASFIKEKNLDIMLIEDEEVDLKEKKYYEKILPTYMKLSRLLKEDGSKTSAIRLFMENVISIRNNYDKVTTNILYKNFFKTEYVKNIQSVFDTEKSFLEEKIEEMKKLINQYERKNDDL